MKKYDHKKIEGKWQKYWQAKKTFQARDFSKKPKKYVLVEFPYPSGEGLHMGHLRPYTAGDVYSRFLRMKGCEVMYPMGWDAFGLPAENFAIKHGVHPAVSTAKNIKNAKTQLQSWGMSFDWSREVNTTDPEYYKWTQWIFLQFFKAGLAYEATGFINWCPKDKTGLANEEVINGRCERCGTQVEKKELRQWYLKITAYAEKLLEGLKALPEWPEAVKLQQENWIGKSVGAEINFGIKGQEAAIKVFTTRPDTIFGATYMVVAPEHPLIKDQEANIRNYKEVKKYLEKAKNKTEIDRTAEGKEKTGVELIGIKAVNPATKEEMPVWVADYVLWGYGTGAIMAVPAHDQRDFEFAKKFGLPIKHVVIPLFTSSGNVDAWRGREPEMVRNTVVCIIKHWSENKYLFLDRQKSDGVRNEVLVAVAGGVEEGETLADAGKREIFEETGYKNAKFIKSLGSPVGYRFYSVKSKENRLSFLNPVYFELTDGEQEAVSASERKWADPVWISGGEISRHFAGRPFNQIFWNRMSHGEGASVESGVLFNSGEFTGMRSEEALPKMAEKFGKLTTQYKLRDWVFSRQRYWGEPIPIVHCEDCGAVPVPEKDLPVKLPKVKQYEPTGTGESPLADIKSWVKTKCPKCKKLAWRETNTMPQWAGSSWYWLRYADPRNQKSFADKKKQKYWTPVDTYFGGMEHTTLHLLYSRFWNLFLYDQGLVTAKEPFKMRKPHGIILAADGEKMSKSRGNVVNPNEIAKKFGADALRMYELFLGPHELTVSWSDQGILGVRRFLDRVWAWANEALKEKQKAQNESPQAEKALHRLIKKISEDTENFRFNTAISAFMEFHNEVRQEKASVAYVRTFLKVLYPFAPHMSEELNSLLGGKKSLQAEQWPEYDDSKLAEETAEVVVQVNGKVRGRLTVERGSREDAVKQEALKIEGVKKAAELDSIKRVIFVPDRLINLVI